jgi:hypothetical protein
MVQEEKSLVKNLVYIYIHDVKFLALLGAPYVYDINRLRVNLTYLRPKPSLTMLISSVIARNSCCVGGAVSLEQ